MAKRKDAGKDRMGKVSFALFAVLLVASIAVITTAWQEASPKVKGEVMVDPDGILKAFLSSTVDEVRYTDNGGNTTIFTGRTVHYLLVEDLEIRNNSTDPNILDLEKDLERRLSDILEDLSGGHHYNLKAFFKGESLKLTDMGIETGKKATQGLHMRTFEGEAMITFYITE